MDFEKNGALHLMKGTKIGGVHLMNPTKSTYLNR